MDALLGGLRSVADAPSLDHALEAVREQLGMEVAYVTRHTDTEQILVRTRGAVETFGVRVGTRLPLEDTYCRHILRGELPGAMGDTLYGRLCAASHEPVLRLAERDLQFLAVLARVIAGEIERDAALRTELALRAQAAGAKALLSAVDARDHGTGTHSRHVVVFACDAWDAMVSDRPYRGPLPRDAALSELAAGASSQFCAACVAALSTVLARG